MPNKIKVSDFINNDVDIQQLINELRQLNTELTGLRENEIKNAAELQATLKKLNATNSANREEIEKTSRSADEIAKRYKKYTDSLDENAVKIAALKNAQQSLNRVNKLEAKLLTAKKGSYDELSAQYSLNKILLNQMSAEERKATKVGKELEDQTREIYEEMKRLQEATGKHTLSVGDYAKANKELIQVLDDLPGQLSGIKGGIDKLDKTMKTVARNPFLAVLSLIVAGLFALGRAFKSSEKGAVLFQKATVVVSTLFDNLVEISVSLYDAIMFVFTNPVQAAKGFGQVLIDNIINRFKAAIELAGALGRTLYEAISFNLEGVKAAASDADEAIKKMVTGLDKAQRDQFAKSVNNYVEELKSEIDASLELANLKRELTKQNRSLTRSIEKLTTTEQTYQSIADDSTRSFAERQAAAEKARKASEERANKEIQIARNSLSIINRRIDIEKANGKAVSELLDEQLDAYRNLAAAERDFTLTVLDNTKVRSELKQDELERDLDILIDAFDNQKTINERRLDDEMITAEQRRNILSETASLANKSFKSQIQTIQEFTKIQVDANDLINESDAVALNQKIRSLGLSEIIEGRLLEIIRERRLALQDLSDAQVELSKKEQQEALKTLKDRQSIEKIDFDTAKTNAEEKTLFAIGQKEKELQVIQELNDKFKNELPAINTAKLEAELRALRKRLKDARQQVLNEQREAALDTFDQEQALEQSKFDLLKSTEKEKTKFRLEAEKERLKKVIELNIQFGGELTDVQLETLRNQIAAIDNELGNLNKRKINDIYDLFGFKLSSDQKSALNESVGLIKSSFDSLLSSRKELADQNVEQANDEIATAQRALEIEIQNRNAGFAHKVETAQKELNAAKKQQEEALKEQRRAQRAQAAIQTLEQSINLTTASSKIWSSFSGLGPAGPFLAASAIALMFGSFIASKIRAAQLAKKTFGDGGLEIIGGGTHASGNDTYLGFQSEGKPAFAERGEAHMIVPAKMTKKYKSELPYLMKSLQKGTFENNYQKLNGSHNSDNMAFIVGSSSSTDMTNTEKYLSKISDNTEEKYYTDSSGNSIRVYKNLRQKYV